MSVVLFSKSFEKKKKVRDFTEKKKKKNSLASVKNQRTEEREREGRFLLSLILFFAIRKEREREKGYNTHLLNRFFFYSVLTEPLSSVLRASFFL